jgi:hypothetical protein
MKSPIKQPELLKETNRDFDFFEFNQYAENLYDALRAENSPVVTTLVGSYGTGKSVLINEVRKLSKKSKKNSPKWIVFECWQYPDKGDLWEALILDLVESIDGESKRNSLASSYSNIEGWRKKFLVFLSDIRGAVATLLAVSLLSWVTLEYANDTTKGTVLALATGLIIVILASFEYLAKQESRSDISRLSDYKQELEKTILSNKAVLYIVLEDVDRAGEMGRQFFETVAHFIKEPKFKKKDIKVIVPIAELGDGNKALGDSIDKASDNILYFTPRYDGGRFVEELFDKNFLDEPTKTLIVSMISVTLGRSINVRKLKHVLRNSIVKHERLTKQGFKSRLAICIAVEMSKYMKDDIGSRNLFDSRSNHYKHKQLFTWASAKGLIDNGESEQDKKVEPRDFFKMSDEAFSDIRPHDLSTNSSTGRLPIYHRDFYISKEYFRDL